MGEPRPDELSTRDAAPLRDGAPETWERFLALLDLPGLLVRIEARMSASLRARVEPEDVLQEALEHAWRDRASIDWRGPRALRSWFLSVVDHRLRDVAERERAAKRGGGAVRALSQLAPPGERAESNSNAPGPIGSTTPSRVASLRERADAIRAALEALPEELREVVRLRLLEELSTEETAARLGLGLSAVKHRLRKGAGLYRAALVRALDTRAGTRLGAELDESRRNP